MKKSILACAFLLTSFAKAADQIDPYLLNPISKYLTKEEYQEVMNESLYNKKDRRNELMEGKIITINTNDSEGCEAVRDELDLGHEVCHKDPKNPLVSVVVMRNSNYDDLEKSIKFSGMTDKQKTFVRETRNLGIIGSGVFGLIYALPESVSKWDKSRGFKHMASKYEDNVKSGPVMDKDDWAINYIGHPISGAAYYTLVRHQGYTAMESFAFSVAMSTFFWEYGIEAFAEIPSIQDLIVTPLIGSLLGELFYNAQLKINDNNGEVLGSKGLGSFVSVVMNPAGAVSNKINKAFKGTIVKDASFGISTTNPMRNELYDVHLKTMGILD